MYFLLVLFYKIVVHKVYIKNCLVFQKIRILMLSGFFHLSKHYDGAKLLTQGILSVSFLIKLLTLFAEGNKT